MHQSENLGNPYGLLTMHLSFPGYSLIGLGRTALFCWGCSPQHKTFTQLEQSMVNAHDSLRRTIDLQTYHRMREVPQQCNRAAPTLLVFVDASMAS